MDGVFIVAIGDSATHYMKLWIAPSLIQDVLGQTETTQRKEIEMRKVRKDCTVGSFEKRHGIPGAIRNENGRDTRSDMTIGNLRKKLGQDSVLNRK